MTLQKSERSRYLLDANVAGSPLSIQQQISSVFGEIREQSVTTISLSDYRAAFDAFAALTTPRQDVTIEALTIDGLAAEWIIPANPIPERVILYFHSGSYISGSLMTDRALVSKLACLTQTKILQVAYRIAPEHPFPIAIYDGLATYRWLLTNGHASHTIALIGVAPGAGIVLSMLPLLREQGKALPVVAALLSPLIDITPASIRAKRHITTDIVFSAAMLDFAATMYAGQEHASSPLASPLYADLHGLPPLFIKVGENEMFHDDGYRLQERARSYNVRAHCITWADMFHGWQAFADVLPKGRLALEQIAAYFEKYFVLAKKA